MKLNPLTAAELTPGLVSVMMPAYNSERFIQQAIDSLLAQVYRNWELILVNDGSTDATLEIASRYTDARIHIINQPNEGEASARNTALANMHGEFVAFLDADDAYLPQHLEVMVAYLQVHPDRDGVYVDGMHIDQDGRMLKSLSSRRRGPFEGWVFEQLVRASDVFGPPVCILLRRRPIIARGLSYDPQVTIGPDWDFNTRFAEHSCFGNLAMKTCLYRIHSSNISLTTDLQTRRDSLSRCRQKAIRMQSFARCTVETRSYVFYELLVELLDRCPERQTEVIQWPEFLALPVSEQARILRLMATHFPTDHADQYLVKQWLEAAARMAPSSWRAQLLFRLYLLSPLLYHFVLKLRNLGKYDRLAGSPLDDVFDGT